MGLNNRSFSNGDSLFNSSFVEKNVSNSIEGATALKLDETYEIKNSEEQSNLIDKFEKKPKLILKYEDIIENKKEIILKIINFFESNYKIKFINIENKLNNIIETTTINNLKKEEINKSSEKNLLNPFFRKGKSRQWKNILTNEQNEIICQKFKKVMEMFNYI